MGLHRKELRVKIVRYVDQVVRDSIPKYEVYNHWPLAWHKMALGSPLFSPSNLSVYSPEGVGYLMP